MAYTVTRNKHLQEHSISKHTSNRTEQGTQQEKDGTRQEASSQQDVISGKQPAVGQTIESH
jgi:hypothetical protein